MRGLQRLAAVVPLPWRRPRHELLLLVLVALAALPQVQQPNTQDVSRLCLTRAIVAGRLSADSCLDDHTEDKSLHAGHLYSNKAPGMSLAELAPAEVVRLGPSTSWDWKGDLRLWFVHLVAAGLPFLLCVFCVGRVSEALAPGFGGACMVTFALGTQMSALAVAGFGHVPAASFGFLAFLLAWSKRPLAAGLAAGTALAFEYEAAAIAVLVLAYVALRGWRPLARYVIGVVPGAALVGAYDWAAFGAPWHNPLSYSDNALAAQERSGLLGIHLPMVHSTGQVFLGDRGLLIGAPVLVAGAAGLAVLWRRGLRAETLLCLGVAVAFLVAECGYFVPYGGRAPGPRFLVPALPFLMLGLGPAFAGMRLATSALAAISVAASSALMLTWQGMAHYRDTVWGEMARVLSQGGSARIMNALPRNVLTWGSTRFAGVAVTVIFTVGAFLIAVGERLKNTADEVTPS